MSNESWEEQCKKFLQKTGEDFRRAGEDIKAEAQRLLDGAMDPDKQQRIRDRLNELGVWARKAAHGVAEVVEEAASKAETAFHSAAEKMAEKVSDRKRASPSSNASSDASGGSRAPSAARNASRTKGKSGKTKKSRGKRKP
jgi:hypothetical protein